MQERLQLVLSVPGDGFSYAGLRAGHGFPALRPDRPLQLRTLLGPAPSLHGLRSGRGRFVRSLPRYFGRVRLLHRAHRRRRPPAFPTTSRPRLAGTAMEISRFPCKRLLRMPGSTTTRGRHVSRDIDTGRVAFCGTENISTPNLSYAAQYLACALPCERFTSALADNPCITRGRCGSLHLHRDGLPPSTSCRSPGAPVHSIKNGRDALEMGCLFYP
jgi:hypothetical protein